MTANGNIILPADHKFLDSFKKTIQNRVELVETEKEDNSHEFEIFSRAPNALEWITRRDFANHPETYGHFGQFQLIRDLFELLCPICSAIEDENCFFINDRGEHQTRARETLESQPLLVWSNKWEDDVCPRCNTTREEFEVDKLFEGYNQCHAVIGMRSGKSDTMALVGTYVEHVLLCIAHTNKRGLHGYFGIPEHETFDITYVAASEAQVSETVWSKYMGRRYLSPWMQRYVEWVKVQASEQESHGMRKWRYNETDTKIENEHPNVRLRCNSWTTSSGTIVGKTRIAGFADEISRMKQTNSASGAEEVYNGLESSLHTIRSRVKERNLLSWLGLMASVTSPIANTDYGMRLLTIGEDINEMLVIHKATWEFNPHEPESGFKSEFKKNPILTRRNFGAKPPESEFPLVEDPERFKAAVINTALEPTANFEIYPRQAKTRHKYTAIRMTKTNYDPNTPRFIVFDAGLNFDSFSGACGHKISYENDEEGEDTHVTVFDWIIRIIPLTGTEVYFESVVDIVRRLHQRMIIERVEFDRWNSVSSIQDIREMGIPAEAKNSQYIDYVRFIQDGYAGKIQMLPELEGEENLLDQSLMSPEKISLVELCELEQDPNSGRIFNPRKGQKKGWHSNDTAQVAVKLHKVVQRSAFVEKHADRSRVASLKRSIEGGARFSSRQGGRLINTGKTSRRRW